jgi:hypothetical protein
LNIKPRLFVIGRSATLCLLGRRPTTHNSVSGGFDVIAECAGDSLAASNKRKALRQLRRLDTIEQRYLKERKCKSGYTRAELRVLNGCSAQICGPIDAIDESFW